MKPGRFLFVVVMLAGALAIPGLAGNLVLKTDPAAMAAPAMLADGKGVWHLAVSCQTPEGYGVFHASANSAAGLSRAAWKRVTEAGQDARSPKMFEVDGRTGLLWVSSTDKESLLRLAFLPDDGKGELGPSTTVSEPGEWVLFPSVAVSGDRLLVSWTSRRGDQSRIRAALVRLEEGKVDRFDVSVSGQAALQSSAAFSSDDRGVILFSTAVEKNRYLLARAIQVKADAVECGPVTPLAVPVTEVHDPILLAGSAGRLRCFFLGRTRQWVPMVIDLENGDALSAGPCFSLTDDEGQNSFLSATRRGSEFLVQWRHAAPTGAMELVRSVVGNVAKTGTPRGVSRKLPGDPVGPDCLDASGGLGTSVMVCRNASGFSLVLITDGRE